MQVTEKGSVHFPLLLSLPPLPHQQTYPMVVINVGENESLAYRNNKHVFPTPESPIINSLICMSKGFSCRAIFPWLVFWRVCGGGGGVV